jgi:hypothetical protein
VDIPNSITPVTTNMIKEIRMEIKAQKEENQKLQFQLSELKKENVQIQNYIVSCNHSIT